MTARLVLIADHGAVRVLTLNRPAARNALSRDLIRAAVRRAEGGRRRRGGARGRAHRRRPGVLRGRRPQGGRARRAEVLRGVPVAELHHRGRRDAHADRRRDQRRDVHRRSGDGAGLRLPDRLRACGVRRYPCAGGHPARRRDDGAAAPGRRRRDGPPAVDDRRGRRRRARRDASGWSPRSSRTNGCWTAPSNWRRRSPRCPARPCWGSRRSTRGASAVVDPALAAEEQIAFAQTTTSPGSATSSARCPSATSADRRDCKPAASSCEIIAVRNGRAACRLRMLATERSKGCGPALQDELDRAAATELRARRGGHRRPDLRACSTTGVSGS